jgi:hypothetical protein
MSPTSTRSRTKKRGNAVVVILPFGVLLGFSALALDVGLIRVVDVELQTALDSASLSGVSELDGTDAGIARAEATAITIASLNEVLTQPVVLTAADVHVGAYDRLLDTFDEYDPGEDPLLVNAVRIDHALPPIAAVLSGLPFGIAQHSRDSRSMSVRELNAGPATTARCSLPLAIPDCHLAGLPPGDNPPPLTFTFNPTPTDSIAWGDPRANPNSNDIRDRLINPCSVSVEVGDPMFVNEGVHNSAVQTMKDILNGDAPGRDTWDSGLYGTIEPPFSGSTVDPTDYGHTYEGPVALVDAGPNCSAVSFTGSLPVTQIAWAVVFDVSDSGGNKFLRIKLDVVNPHDVWGETDPGAVGNVSAPGEPGLAGY